MAQKREAHPKHNDLEYIVAALFGVGLMFAAGAAMFAAFGSRDEFVGLTLTRTFQLGAVLMVFAGAVWLALLRPWENFDDLKTPYFTGHDHDDHAEESHEPARALQVEVASTAVQVAEPQQVDDLAVIEGIGPRVKQALADAGITSYAQLAASRESDLQKILDDAGIKLVKPTTWAKQAKYIVDNDAQGFSAYVDKLKGGTIEPLEQIEGIGPKVKQALVDAGIRTFADLAASNEDDLRKVLDRPRMKHINPSTWAKQAQFMVDGDVEGFEAYKARLNAGQEPD